MLIRLARNVLLLVILTLVASAPFTADAQTGEDVFTVSDVRVDVTAENAVAAREKAFVQAQGMAFSALAEKLANTAPDKDARIPDPSVISGMIKDFEVTDEQLSDVRYIGTYTFRFNGSDVRNHFSTHGVSYSDVAASHPVLVLPFHEAGSRSVIWSDPNPWRDAWARNADIRKGLVPIAVPLGDLQDIAGIGDDQALTYDSIALRSLLDRYNAAEAIIMVSRVTSQDGAGVPLALDIMVYRTDRGGPEHVRTLKVTSDQAGDAQKLYDRAVADAHSAIQSDWRAETAVDPQTGVMQTVLLKAEFDTMQQWVETRQALKRVQGISDMKIRSVTPREAQIEVIYVGHESRLRLALEQADLSLGGSVPGDVYGYQLPTYTVRLKKYAPF